MRLLHCHRLGLDFRPKGEVGPKPYIFNDFDGEKSMKNSRCFLENHRFFYGFSAQDFLLRALHGGQPLPGTKLGIDKGGGHSF